PVELSDHDGAVVGGGVFALDSIHVESQGDVTLKGKMLAASIDVDAGTDGSGSVLGTLYGDVQGTSAIDLSAGNSSGSIVLTDTSLTSGGTVTLTASNGEIRHSGGVITAAGLTATARDGFSANTAAASANLSVTGAGDIHLVNSGQIAVTATAANGAISIESFGAVTAVSVQTLGTSDAHDITIRTHSGGITVTSIATAGAGDV